MENLTVETFNQKVYNVTNNQGDLKFLGTRPAIVDFYAEWCGPCKMIAPVLEELSQHYTDIDFYKVDTDECSEIAAKLGIRNVPSLWFIAQDGTITRQIGAVPKAKLMQIIANAFNK